MSGQFDDAQEAGDLALTGLRIRETPSRKPLAYIDDDDAVAGLNDDAADNLEDCSDWDLSTGGDDWDDGAEIRVDDEDWEIAQRDFTKHYNRLRQHAAVQSGDTSSAKPVNVSKSTAGVISLPPINKPRVTSVKAQPAADANSSIETDQLTLLQKYNSHLHRMHENYAGTLGHVGVNRKGPMATANQKDKADRATTEQVLDPRTRLILLKMIGRGVVSEINGCISTGKEANVYHAFNPTQSHLALKIYKTSILVFKDRDRYVTGEHRFRRGYARHNPRKMVRMWAEKEMRNLKRLHSSGVRCPEAVEVRENVLVMEFLGDEDGWPSPRLKDALPMIPQAHFQSLYIELLMTLRRLFWQCRLVHADLSEYNILYHRGHLYIIDVSQSVEHDHPHAFDFLRSDIRNMEDTWKRHGVSTLGLRRTFDWIVTDHETLRTSIGTSDKAASAIEDPCASLEPEDDRFAPDAESDELQRILIDWLSQSPSHEDQPQMTAGEGQLSHDITDGPKATISNTAQEDAIFLSSYIPRSLNDVLNPEKDADKLAKGEGPDIMYRAAVPGLAKLNGEAGAEDKKFDQTAGEDAESEDTEASDAEDESGSEDGDMRNTKAPRGHRNEDREAKKERQRAAKEAAREKRKTKMPKAEKQQKIKKTKRW